MEFQIYSVKEKKKRKEVEEKKSHKNYIKKKIYIYIGTKLTNTKKLKLKMYSRVWNFKNTMFKKRRKKKWSENL